MKQRAVADPGPGADADMRAVFRVHRQGQLARAGLGRLRRPVDFQCQIALGRCVKCPGDRADRRRHAMSSARRWGARGS
jgi:hypothetical protein